MTDPLEIEWPDEVEWPEEVPERAFRLRDYQQEWRANVTEDRKTFTRILGVAATGSGKTTLFACVASDEWHLRGKRTLVLENRDKLVRQTAKRIRDETGLEVDIEMADDHASPFAPVVVASVQTLCRDGRLTGFAENHFGLVVSDECFPGGVAVDGREIRDVCIGDFVNSFNHNSARVEARRVTNVFKAPARTLVTVTLVNGETVSCTPEHPFFSVTQAEYVAANRLTCDDVVACITRYGSTNENTSSSDVRKLRAAFHDQYAAPEPVCEKRHEGLLHTDMPGCLSVENEFRENGSNQSEARIEKDDGKQPHGSPRKQRENEDHSSGDGVEANCPRRKRDGADGSPAAHGVGARVADGNGDLHKEKGRIGIPDLLQGGCRESNTEGRCGGGWIQPPTPVPEISGRKEGQSINFFRVDRVEVHKQGSGAKSDAMCRDGFVYNLEVEGNNNYFANGILVHNCHHSLAKSFSKVLNYFHYGAGSLVTDWIAPVDGQYIPFAHALGVTATPELGAKQSLAEFYQKQSFSYQYLNAVRDGWLVPPVTKNIPLKIDLKGLRTGRTPNGSDFKPGELSERLIPVLEALADQIVAEASDRKGIVFVPSIECARLLADAITRKGLRGIFVSGECLDVDEKTQAFVDAGPGTFLCNACLYVEGADFPDVSCVIPARATKSVGFYKQQIGRGTRVLPGTVDHLPTADLRRAAIAASAKPNLLILDPLWISDRIDLCDAYDLFTDKPEVKAKMKVSGAAPTEATAEQAERDFIKALEKEAKKHARKSARTIDPLAWALSIGDAALANWVPETAWDSNPPTSGQVDFLRKHGIDCANIKYKGLASKIVGRVISRINLGLATASQLDFMHKLGLDEQKCATMTIREASALIDATKAAKAARDQPVDPI